MVNWALNFTVKFKIHFLLTLLFALLVISQAVWYCDLRLSARDGRTDRATKTVDLALNSLYRATLFITILLGASGWYIVRKDLPAATVVLGIITVAGYIVCHMFRNYVHGTVLRITVAIVGVVFLAGWIKCVSNAIKSASVYVVAHLLVIQKSGIAPRTTPIYQKFVMLKQYFRFVIVYCILLVFTVFFEIFLAAWLWPPRLMASVVDSYICIAMAWLMSIRKERRRNYIQLDDDEENGENSLVASEMVRSEVEKIGAEKELSTDGRPYEEGMALPPAPRLVESLATPLNRSDDPSVI
jgi:hypothetical protein